MIKLRIENIYFSGLSRNMLTNKMCICYEKRLLSQPNIFVTLFITIFYVYTVYIVIPRDHRRTARRRGGFPEELQIADRRHGQQLRL